MLEDLLTSELDDATKRNLHLFEKTLEELSWYLLNVETDFDINSISIEVSRDIADTLKSNNLTLATGEHTLDQVARTKLNSFNSQLTKLDRKLNEKRTSLNLLILYKLLKKVFVDSKDCLHNLIVFTKSFQSEA